MLDQEMRAAIYRLHQEGKKTKELARLFSSDRKTIRRIIKNGGVLPASNRSDQIKLDDELLQQLFKQCDGYVERVHEELQGQGSLISYSTLTNRVRKLGLRDNGKERSCKVEDVPGDEFQHDTSPYVLEIGGKKRKVQGSLTYYRYSKKRCLKFYPTFTRFDMKNFFYEALNYLKYVGKTCIIDNTNLAVLRGTGANAVFHPEMEAFAKMYGFKWKAHAIKHSDRKAGNERAFWTVETNFIPGRTFCSWEDLNRQALLWVEKLACTPNKKTKVIPNETFEVEKTFLKKVPEGLPAPYRSHERGVDQYGFIAFNANFYWTPGKTKGKIMLFEYADKIKIFQDRKELIVHKTPPYGMKGVRIIPEGVDPNLRPKKISIPPNEEEKRIIGLGENFSHYLEEGKKHNGSISQKYQFIRKLYALSRRLSLSLFEKTVDRAQTYKIYDVPTLEKIASIILANENLPPLEFDILSDFETRDNYLEGELSEEPDLSIYDNKYNRKNNENE